MLFGMEKIRIYSVLVSCPSSGAIGAVCVPGGGKEKAADFLLISQHAGDAAPVH